MDGATFGRPVEWVTSFGRSTKHLEDQLSFTSAEYACQGQVSIRRVVYWIRTHATSRTSNSNLHQKNSPRNDNLSASGSSLDAESEVGARN